MECISFRRDTIEQQIIYNLQSSVINRRKAEEQIFCKYSYLIKAAIKKYDISEDDAFNAYSDTILSAIDSICNGTFEGRCSLSTYLHGIFYHKSVDVVRKKTAKKNRIHKTVQIREAELLSDKSISTIEKLVAKFDFDILKQKLDHLGGSSKQALLLSVQGYTDKEIAGVLQFKTADVVKTTRLRCIKKLYRLLNNTYCTC